MNTHPGTTAHVVRLSVLSLALAASFLLPAKGLAAFGLTNSGGYYTVDNGANLVFKIQQSTADMTSCKYKGTEYQSQSSSQKSHIGSGFGTSASVSATVSGNYIKVTCNGTVGGDAVTHYYIVNKGVDNIYMATYCAPNIGELRWVGWITSPSTTQDAGMAARSSSANATVIEAGDVYRESDGTTRSKYYGTQMMKDWGILGKSGSGVGVYMAHGKRESSAGGPFFKDIQSHGNAVYNYMYSGHHQPETMKGNVLHGPYALMFTAGTKPSAQPDMSFVSSLGLTGYVGASGRGTVKGSISGLESGTSGLVAFSNSTAQYWASGNTSYTCSGMKPGTYTATLYQGQLAVKTGSATVSAGGTTTLNLSSGFTNQSAIWRIGKWDGTPLEFKYGTQTISGIPYLTYMHPSDSRMSWPATTYTVGSSATNVFPAYQWQNVNTPTTVKFNLTSSQVAARTVRIGITDAYNSGRPKITINSWTSSNPSASGQPGGRSLTVGTYRGNNTTYTYSVPASAFVTGQNTMTINIITGSSGPTYLSGSVSYDCLDMY